MSPFPEFAPQDLLLGLTSTGLLLWTLLIVIRSRVFGDILAQPSLDDEELGLFQYEAPRKPYRQLAFVGSIFLHIAVLSLLPWVEKIAPGKLPFRVNPYDFVVVQFKTIDSSLALPSNLAELLPPPPPAVVPPPPRDAEPSDVADPGLGDRRPAPIPPAPEPAGGAEQAPAAPVPEPSLVERVEIQFAERVAPQKEALAAASPSGLDIPTQQGADLSWQFAAMELPAVPDPGLIDAQDSVNPSPELVADTGNLPVIIRGTAGDQAPSGRPSLVELVGAANSTDLGANSEGLTAAESDAIRSLLAESFGDGTLLDLIAAAEGAGRGDGPRVGDEVGSGIVGEYGGEGFGEGWRGRGPLPRKLHGIIVISDESAIPEAEGVLQGNPVYTVYIDVPGFDRKWILQVCATDEERGGLQIENGVLRIVTRKKMDPPFAFRRVGPKIDYESLDPYSTPPRVVVYAKVDASGAIGDLRIVSGLDPETDDRVLASMRGWDFHPAYRDGEAVEVEALFGIPLR
jgi:hypothetical protein